MSRLVHELYAPAHGGEAQYATPDGEIVQVPQDFAFADTIVALDEEIPTAPLSQPPRSGPRSQPPRSQRQSQPPRSHEAWAGANEAYETPYEAPDAPMYAQQYPSHSSYEGPPSRDYYANNIGHDPGLVTSFRGAYHRAKHTVETSRSEMQQLWSATDDLGAARVVEEDPFIRLAGVMRRMRTLWSFFEWDRADVMRAAWIGIAVFVTVATVGAFALQR